MLKPLIGSRVTGRIAHKPHGSAMSRSSPGWEAVRNTAAAGSTPERDSSQGRCSRYGLTSTSRSISATRSASGPAGTSVILKPSSR